MPVKHVGGKVLKEMTIRAGKGSIKAVEVGFFESARYIDGTPVAAVAVKNEFGLGVPERPFFRLANEAFKAIRKNYIRRKADPKKMIISQQMGGELGELYKSAVQDSIVDLREPPNSPATIAAKGGKDNPLIDTALMLNSVTYKVIP